VAARQPSVCCRRVAMVHRYHAHTTCMVAVWSWYTDTVPTTCLRLPCGHGTWTPCPLGIDTVATRQPYTTWWHGVRVPCPHSNCTYRVATACVYRGHTATIHIVWARTPWPHGILTLCQHGAYGRRVAMVYGHHAHTVCTVTVWLQYTDTVPTPHVWLVYAHGILTPCQHCAYCRRAATVHGHHAHLV